MAGTQEQGPAIAAGLSDQEKPIVIALSCGFLVRATVNHGLGGVDVDWAAGFGFNSHNTLMIFHSPLNLATER